MHIRSISLRNFRKFTDERHSFGPGLNELVRDNEWGKTTLVDAVRFALCDDKLSPEDVTLGSSNEPEIVVEMAHEEETVTFEARGTAMKPKTARDRIERFLGKDYNYLARSLLIVRHRDIEAFAVDRTFIERALRLENITEYRKKLADLFVQSGEFRKPAMETYRALAASVGEAEKAVGEMEEGLARRRETEARLAGLRTELAAHEDRATALASDEEALSLFLAKAEADERGAKLARLREREKAAEESLRAAREEAGKIEGLLAALRERVAAAGSDDPGPLYRSRMDLEGRKNEDEKSLAELSRLKALVSSLEGKTAGTSAEQLEKDLTTWGQANARVEAGGRIGVRAAVNGDTAVMANESALEPGTDMEYQDRVRVRVGRDVTLDIWAGGKGTARAAAFQEKMAQTYGTMENLKDLRAAHEELLKARQKAGDILKGAQEGDLEKRYAAGIAELKAVEERMAAAEKSRESREKLGRELLALEKEDATLRERVAGLDRALAEARAEIAAAAQPEGSAADGFTKKLNALPYGLVEKYRGMDSLSLRAASDEARTGKEAALKSIISLKDRIQEAGDGRVDVSEGALEAKRASLRALIERKRSADHYLAVLRGLNVLFPALEDGLHENVINDIEKKTLEYLSMITGRDFTGLRLENGGKNETLFTLTNAGGHDLDGPSFLSDGTRDQLFFALRFAMINRFSGGGPRFLVLDEPFAHTDREREKRMREVLDVFVKEGWQILVFACRT